MVQTKVGPLGVMSGDELCIIRADSLGWLMDWV